MTTITYDYSPEAAEQQGEILYQAIRQMQQDSGDTLYLLVDPVLLLQRTDTPFVQTLVNRAPACVPLPHKTLPQSAYPWLLALDRANEDDQTLLRNSIIVALEELHPESLCQNRGRGICGWLTSGASMADLIKQLGHTAVQKQPNQGSVLMRYYDPAVHSLLWSQLNEMQQRRMGGLLSGWLFPDGDGQLVMHRFQPARVLYSTFSLGLSAEQHDFILSTCGIINRTLRRYRQQNSHQLRHPEQAAASYILLALARQAGHPALQQSADKERFALQILQFHPAIDQHPKITDLLDPDTFGDNVSWTKRTLNITPETWQRYARELAESQTTENQ
ncbi:DUF4123 domain-containing protein [Pantoea sp. FN060301]|uniref:DUF4123 domain-containing protein n=1 Tax=Pantoea sp. FN060301 TaxID=3420380 RepID=UPI003D16D21B